jgi:TolB-like protein/DNA-binding winged helix-turn-helix (wHTH) protein/tetratricopeptide (TPR) repeat protein
MEPLRNPAVVKFGSYEIVFESGEVRRAGVRIKVQQQPLKLLEILLERPGVVVTREELRSRVWVNESFGDFDKAVNIAIAKLRSALGDSAENPRFIETIPKRGYRFIAEVSVVDGEISPTRAEPESGGLPGKDSDLKAQGTERPFALLSPRRHLPALWIFTSVAVLVLFLFAVWRFRPGSRVSTGIRSIAVLPLANFSGDASQDYFADGMTDQLITDLAQISALRVISRTSAMAYKGTRKPLPEIAQELHVDAVVEGAVERSGDRVRITAQLIEASSDKHLWAESYEDNVRDTLTLQNKVASAIAERIRIQLTPAERAGLHKADVVVPEAYQSYLKGRFFWNKRTPDGLKIALAYFNQALEEDPNYAQAYAGLADSYDLLGDWEYGVLAPDDAYPKAKGAASKALELDRTLGEAHTSLAFSFDVFDWDWAAAEGEFKRAIELNPGYATAHHWYAWHLSEMGRNDEAIAEMRKAENLDPLSLIISAEMAEILLVAHRNDEAIEQSRKTIAMDSNFAIAHLELGQAFVQKHLYNEAIAELQRAIDLSGGSTTCTSNLAYAYAFSGQRNKATTILGDLKNRPKQNAPEIAMIYVGLEDKDQAMTWLEKAYAERFNPSILLRPAFDPLRSDPRFQNLVHRIGLASTDVPR